MGKIRIEFTNAEYLSEEQRAEYQDKFLEGVESIETDLPDGGRKTLTVEEILEANLDVTYSIDFDKILKIWGQSPNSPLNKNEST